MRLSEFQQMIGKIYGRPDDQMFSLYDLLSNQERFTMRALKGIRKGSAEKLKTNLLISFSWLMSVANRLHINTEEVVWSRFPYKCSYCGLLPCACREIKQDFRSDTTSESGRSAPNSIGEYQRMFAAVYPPQKRDLVVAGIHLAEEMGEMSEAVHNFAGEHKQQQFENIRDELADYISCIFGVANSANIDLESELKEFFKDNCHVCHKAPCECNFAYVATFNS